MPLSSLQSYRIASTRACDWYDLGSGAQFSLMIFLGLREYHRVLDLACGPIRLGRLLIPYLLPGNYFGIDPNLAAVSAALRYELGDDIIHAKRPVFADDDSYTLSMFGLKFDFIMASGIMPYMGRPQLQRCLAEAKKVMAPTAVLLATILEAGHGKEGYTGSKSTFPVVIRLSMDYLSILANENGLELHRVEWPYRNLAWVAFTHLGKGGGFTGLYQRYARFIEDGSDPERYI